MRPIIVVLLATALAAAQALHGGLMFSGLVWPAVVAACAAALLAGASNLREEMPAPGRASLVLGLLLAAWAFLRWSMQEFPAQGFLPVANLVAGVLAFGAVVLGLRSANLRLALVGCILATGLAQLLQAAAWRYLGQGIEPVWFCEPFRDWYAGRFNPALGGFYINRNHLAWLLNACCIFCAALCVWARIPPALKFLCGWFAGVFALGTLLALSRGGALGLASGMLVFLLLSFLVVARARARFRIPALVLLGVLMTGLAAACAHLIWTHFQVQQRLEMVTEDVYREQLWTAVMRQLQASPLTGSGPGSFSDAARMFRPGGIATGEAVHAHNDWLQLAAEFGWTGMALVVLLLAATVLGAIGGVSARATSAAREGLPQSSHLATVLGAVACLGAFAVHSFFDFNMQLGANSLLAFCVLGLAAAGAAIRSRDAWRAPLWPTRVAGGLLAACAGLFLAFSADWFLEAHRLLQLENAMRRGPAWLAEELAARVYSDQSRHPARHLAAGEVWAGKASRLADLPAEQQRLRTRAAWHYLQASDASPGDRFPLLRLAAMRSLRGEHPTAYFNALEGVRLDPFNAMAYEYLGGVGESAGDFPLALRIYELANTVPGSSGFGRGRLRGLRQLQRDGRMERMPGPAIPAFRESNSAAAQPAAGLP